MNILKLFSTTQKGLPGDYLLALYAWLLNPKMDHGLNIVALNSFLKQLRYEHTELPELAQDIEDFPKKFLHTIEIQMQKVLSPNSTNSIIADLVISIDTWSFVVLNTIDLGQSYDRSWLTSIYQAAKQHFKGQKLGMIILTQSGKLGQKHPAFISYSEIQMTDHHDFKCVMGWEPAEKSVYNAIQAIRDYFVEDLIESTEQILQTFDEYLSQRMSGYQGEEYSFLYGNETIPIRQLRIKEIMNIPNGWVKIPNGLSGMLRMRPEHLEVYNFSYTTTCMQRKRFWIEIDVLKEFVQWFLYQSNELQIDRQRILLNTVNLFKLVDKLQNKIFIHIEEGLLTFRVIGMKDLDSRVWHISYTKLTKKDKSKWINGLQFLKEISSIQKNSLSLI
jgi:hypothetical protein